MDCLSVKRDKWHMSERGRSTWVFYVSAKYNHKCPCRKTEGSVTAERKGHKQGDKIEKLLGVKKY